MKTLCLISLCALALMLTPACDGSGSSGGVEGNWTLDSSGMSGLMEGMMTTQMKESGLESGPMAEQFKAAMNANLEMIKKMEGHLQLLPGGKSVMKGRDMQGNEIDKKGTWILSGSTLTIIPSSESDDKDPINYVLDGDTLTMQLDEKTKKEMGGMMMPYVFRRK